MDGTGILLIDPCTLFRSGMRRLLPEDMHIVAEASDVAGAMQILGGEAAREAVGLVLLDVPREDRLKEELAALRAALPKARIVHLTTTPTAERVQALFEAGGEGCLGKDCSAEALAQSIRLVAMGEKVFPSDLMALLQRSTARGPSGAGPNGLSTRETQILKALLAGLSNKAIAISLGITEATVKVHLKSLMKKLNVANRTQAAIWGMNNGVLPDSAQEPPRTALAG